VDDSTAGASSDARGPLPDGFPPAAGTLDRALSLVAWLRAHCPWDGEQTPASLVPHLLEETHEVVDAIHDGDPQALRGELGDLLLNLAFQVVIAEEEGHFSREEVISELESKMVRRHPDLFGRGEKERWEVIKSREREASRGASSEASVAAGGTLQGLATGLDPLHRAHRVQEKVSGVGFDWEDPSGALAKVREELEEVEEALAGSDAEALAEEVGDLLFAVVNLARLARTHPVPSLERANRKFIGRFNALEALAHERGVPIPGASLAEMDELWDEVKRGEAKRGEGAASSGASPDPGGRGSDR